MARIVAGLGATHGPLIDTPPEAWDNLGLQDMNDPRMDFQAVLARAKPGMEAELTMEKKTERYAATQAAIRKLEEVLTRAKADTIVNISNLHGDIPDYEQQIFGVYTGAFLPKPVEAQHGPDFFRSERDESSRPSGAYPGDPELANYLFERLNNRGFDVHACVEKTAGGGIGWNYTFVYPNFAKEGTLPMVPFMLSRILPNQATPKRCYELGQALREEIEAWDPDRRVAVIASGGLSHQVVDEELDRIVVDALVEKDVDVLCSLPRDRLNASPGTPEILNWVTVEALMDAPMTLASYQPCYRSLAGTGSGVTFGYWEV